MARSRRCRRQFELPLSRSRTSRRSGEWHEQLQFLEQQPPWKELVLAYVLAAARAERRGQLELAQELQACASELVERVDQ